jgi:hypothetical protein
MRSVKNPIPQYFGTSFLKKSDFLGYALRQKSDPSILRDKLFEKIGFFGVMRSVKNPIPQYFGTSFLKKSDFLGYALRQKSDPSYL